MGGTTFALGCPCNRFKIKWIEFFRLLKPGKSFSTDAILEYCEYQKAEGLGAPQPAI
jgi:hypothetical protein